MVSLLHAARSASRRWVVAALVVAAVRLAASPDPVRVVQFVFTSDSHFGTTRKTFRGGADVPAAVVNAAMVARINALPAATLPRDGGLGAGQAVGPIDFVADGGDIANRAEQTDAGPIQGAAASWAQFAAVYIHGLSLTAHDGQPAPLYIIPGNHDVSNAIGFYRPMTVDKTSLVEMYNRMMKPATPETAATYRYADRKILYSRDLGGVHFVFITMWPDSGVRSWMTKDLAGIGAHTPVIVFAHDQPESQAKHFINPNGAHDINGTDRFENLLADTLADGPTIAAPTTIEQRALQNFLKAHPNITAYFHGNTNGNQYYEWTGPDHAVSLHTFRVDSPMKGADSAKDETKLSFQLATIDARTHAMTVRECLWNADPARPGAPIAWGESTTVSLAPAVRIR